MNGNVLVEWDGLLLTTVECHAMESGIESDGEYEPWQIVECMAYPRGAAGRLLGDGWAYQRWHRDTAIAFVRFVIASRAIVEVREELERQLKAEQLRKELAMIAAAK